MRRLIIDPATDTITHLVIQPGHDKQAARLVPVHLAEPTDGGVRLGCTRAEFDQLDHAEKRELAGEADYIGRVGGHGGAGDFINMGSSTGLYQMSVEDVVPMGEGQVRAGDRVHAADGEIGRVQGFLVSPGDDRLTHVLLQQGHLWGAQESRHPHQRRDRVDAGIRLNLTKEQIGNLPPAD